MATQSHSLSHGTRNRTGAAVLRLANGHQIVFGGRVPAMELVRSLDIDGLIIEGSHGFNELGLVSAELAKRLGIDDTLLRSRCAEHTSSSGLTLLALQAREQKAGIRMVVLVPNQLSHAYSALATPRYGKPYRDLCYNVTFEGLRLLHEHGCRRIGLAQITGCPVYKESSTVGDCIVEAIAQFGMAHRAPELVLCSEYAADVSHAISFYNERPSAVGEHREVVKLVSCDNGGSTRVTIVLPPREGTLRQ
jgi:hypothetical protein